MVGWFASALAEEPSVLLIAAGARPKMRLRSEPGQAHAPVRVLERRSGEAGMLVRRLREGRERVMRSGMPALHRERGTSTGRAQP